MKYKKNSGKGKLREKFHSQRVAQKKCSCVRKNIPAKEMLTKKIRAARKFPTPIAFLMVRPLADLVSSWEEFRVYV